VQTASACAVPLKLERLMVAEAVAVAAAMNAILTAVAALLHHVDCAAHSLP